MSIWFDSEPLGVRYSATMKRPKGMRVIGLTGGIGAGKSELARSFWRVGVPVVDADRIAREQMRRGQAVYDEVVAVFGPSILGDDQEVDRRRLARAVFADPDNVRTLNRITHPPVVAEVERRLAILAEMGYKVAVVEAALLVETGIHAVLDGLVVVTAPEEERIARVAVRDHVEPEEVRSRIAAQVSDYERLQAATAVVTNDGPIENLLRQAVSLALRAAIHSEEGTS